MTIETRSPASSPASAMEPVSICRPDLSPEDIEQVVEVLRTGALVQGKFVERLESAWGVFVGARENIAVSSGTAALHLALLAYGIGSGDEVLVPALTWAATANVVELVGATPVFVDIDLGTFNVDITKLEARVTPRTRAVIPVHLFGLPAPLKPVYEFARRYNLFVIEDAACAFGAKQDGNLIGSSGEMVCFSLHPRKAITTGEGGIVSTSSASIAAKLRALRNHGLLKGADRSAPDPADEFDVGCAGLNYRMTDFQAALGVSQMGRADAMLASRRQWADRYRSALTECSGLRLPMIPPGSEHSFQAFVLTVCSRDGALPESSDGVELAGRRREKLMRHLAADHIQSRPPTQALHLLSYYREKYSLEAGDFFNAYAANRCGLAVPLSSTLQEEEFERVCNSIKTFCRDQ